ncbi:hypothetical protein L3X38_032433 [Prunus dulcis]|uniref:Uncharacterized protein n=1 Tax=Prunus dulcis TaxID=3755 RepID=A0AAD4YVW8_PRUDU|nr:hypothetical protein L3X38_032433 [Prunus dulcis]
MITKWAVLGRVAFYKTRKGKINSRKTKDSWNSIFAWTEASDLDWTGYVYAGLDYQQLQLLGFSRESIPKFEFGRALIYFKPWKALERAELPPFQSERGRSGWI